MFTEINVFLVSSVIFGACLEEITNINVTSMNDIRKTVNRLFLELRLRDIREKPKLQEYATIHKYFASLSSQDQNIKKIKEITKVNNDHKMYNASDFIAIINENMDKDKTNTISLEDMSVTSYIEKFIARLKALRESYASKTVYVKINTQVLEHLKHFKSSNKTLHGRQDDYEDNVHTDEVWEPSGRRIYKGERTKIKYFPFMASVHIFNNFHCAGSIIKSDLIITASSCLQLAWNNRLFRENPAFLSVRVGSSFYGGGGEVIPVLEIYFHSGYNPKSLRNNLCLLRLSRHLKFRRRMKRVKRIDIDRNPWNLPLNTPGITILGWGAKGRSGVVFDPWKNILSYSMLDIYPLQDCQDVYTKEYVTSKHFCAGFLSKGGGACNRDVGAPGVVDGKLMGVVSFGAPTCGTPDAPTVFTKLGHYTDWIEDIMEQPVPVSKKQTTEKPIIDIFTYWNTARPTTTTFKIAPIIGKTLAPLSIHDVDQALRLLDENLFKEFVSTMFTSAEIEQYQNIARQENEKSTTEQTTTEKLDDRIQTYKKESVNFVTKMPELYEELETTDGFITVRSDSEEIKMEYQDPSSSDKEQILKVEKADVSKEKVQAESDLVDFLKNIDLKKIIQEEVKTGPHKQIENKGTNESVVTFVYLSDADKAADRQEGLSIETEPRFEDMTRTKANISNIMPENQLYGLISDVIEEEVKNKLIDDSM